MARSERLEEPSERATSADVARLAGVSRATVSLVLNDRADEIRISARTRDRVAAAAARLGYRPNHAASSLRRRRTGVLAFVLSSLDSIYNSEVVSAAQAAADRRGYSLNVMSVRSPELEARAFALLQSGAADGVIVSVPPEPIVEELGRITNRGIPVVLLQQHSPDPAITAVRVDLEAGGHVATRHLLALGHRRIAHIGNEAQHLLERKDRTDGYLRALREAGLSPDPTLVAHGETGLAGGCRAMHVLLDRANPPPTAAFIYNDQMAVGALHALRERGLRVPQDMAVIGFDGIALGRYVAPTLSTIDHARDEVGRVAADTLADLLADGASRAPERVLPVRLVLRQSCGGLESGAALPEPGD